MHDFTYVTHDILNESHQQACKLTFEINVKVLVITKLKKLSFCNEMVLSFSICPIFSSRFGILVEFKTKKKKIGKQNCSCIVI